MDWIKKTPIGETDSNQRLKTLCDKIFNFFDIEKQNKLNEAVAKLGKLLKDDEQRAELAATLKNFQSGSNPKETQKAQTVQQPLPKPPQPVPPLRLVPPTRSQQPTPKREKPGGINMDLGW